jgi:hypothetical protein
MFGCHEVVHFNLKCTRTIVTISGPHPTIHTLTIQTAMVNGNVQFVSGKVFGYKPLYNTLAAAFRVVITSNFKR